MRSAQASRCQGWWFDPRAGQFQHCYTCTRQWLLVWIDATYIFHFPCFKNHFFIKKTNKIYFYLFLLYPLDCAKSPPLVHNSQYMPFNGHFGRFFGRYRSVSLKRCRPTGPVGGALPYFRVLGMCRWTGFLFELPALAQGVFFELPELGQGPFLSFQLWAPAQHVFC